jgi:hypothetical protein
MCTMEEGRRVCDGQILCIRIFYCKMCKTEESMVGQFRGRFVYLQNSGTMAKYGIWKQPVKLIFEIEDRIFRERTNLTMRK